MRSLLILTAFCILTASCHKSNHTPIKPFESSWRLIKYEQDGPWTPLQFYDTYTLMKIESSGLVTTYDVSLYLSQPMTRASYDLSTGNNPGDSIINFTQSLQLTSDNSLQSGLKAQINIYHGDSLVLSGLPILPSGRGYFIFKKQPN